MLGARHSRMRIASAGAFPGFREGLTDRPAATNPRTASNRGPKAGLRGPGRRTAPNSDRDSSSVACFRRNAAITMTVSGGPRGADDRIGGTCERFPPAHRRHCERGRESIPILQFFQLSARGPHAGPVVRNSRNASPMQALLCVVDFHPRSSCSKASSGECSFASRRRAAVSESSRAPGNATPLRYSRTASSGLIQPFRQVAGLFELFQLFVRCQGLAPHATLFETAGRFERLVQSIAIEDGGLAVVRGRPPARTPPRPWSPTSSANMYAARRWRPRRNSRAARRL